jgi:hypothetical protein
MLFRIFGRKRQKNFSPGDYRIDNETYEADCRLFTGQPARVLRELKTVKIVMAVFIPLFFIMSAISTEFAVYAGCLSGVPPALIFIKHKNFKPAAAVPVSIATGIVFGCWFQQRLGGFPL